MSEIDDTVPVDNADNPEASAPGKVVTTSDPATQSDKASVSAPEPRRSSDGLARSLVILLWLLLAAVIAAGWYRGWPILMEREARLEALESRLQGLSADAESRVTASVDPLRQRVAAAEQQLAADAAAQRTSLAAMQRDIEEALRRTDTRFLRLEEKLSRLTATDRRAWLVQEAAFMVRLAGQRLAVVRDVESARALLQTADDLLLEADDPLLDAARRALAVDLAALRSISLVDVVGIDARLQALVSESAQLTLVEEKTVATEPVAGDWLARAKAGWQAALAKLSDYLVIRQRTRDLASLLTPEWEQLARQNLRMLFEQAQIALLSGNRTLYSSALARAHDFASLFAAADPDRVTAMLAEVDSLADLDVAPALPDLMASRRALADASRQLVGETEG